MTKWTKEQSEAIYKFGSNIIVSAGAGSGKTAVLTERVLEKVKSGVSLSNLLILTFTKMAAKEMRERIGSKLKKEGLTKELSFLDTADITTFDAYALSLVKKYHYYLDVARDINIIDPSVISLYKKKVLNDIFENLYKVKDKNFLSLIKNYSLKDDKELFSFILNVNDRLDLKINKKKYLNDYLEIMFSESKIEEDIFCYTREILKQVDLIRQYLDYIEENDFLEKLYSVISPLLDSKSYDEIKMSIDFTLPRAINVSDTTKEYKEKISSVISDIKKLVIYKDSDEIRKSIINTKDFVGTIIDIIIELDEKVSEYKNKYDYYEYNDIARLAIKLVKEHNNIREEIKNNLNEISIDEYQDTSDIQEEFISYISNNNVYMVGDIKQSIYRFRNANPYIFKNKYDKYSQSVGGIKIDLNKNFRSRREVIDNINFIFNRIMDDDLGGAAYSTSHQMVFGNLAYEEDKNYNQDSNFEVYTYSGNSNFKKEEIEAFIIASDIKNKVRDGYLVFDRETNKNRKAKYSDFVILMDNSKNFELFKKILEYNDIPTSIMKNGNLTEGEVILVIKNIISFIIKVKDNVIDTEFKRLFISLGRSFIFNIPDETLFDYFMNNSFYESEIYQKTKVISDNIDSISLNDIIDIIINEFDFYNKLILVGDYNLNVLRIDKLKEITNNLINLDYSIYEYCTYLNDIVSDKMKIEYQVNDINQESVKIMTIHASKGLEFSICYYAGLYSKFNIREATNKFSYDNKYGIILPYREDFLYNTIYHNLSYKDYVRENISERIRLFYVAVTRAREKMIFLLPAKNKESNSKETNLVDISIRNKYSSFASMLYSLEPAIERYYRSINIEDVNLTKNYNLIKNSNYKEEINIVDDKILVSELNIVAIDKNDKSFSKKQSRLLDSSENENINYGLKIHELFELIDFNNIDYSILDNNERKVIDNFLKHIDVKDSQRIYKEYEFVYSEDDSLYHGIIDLMVEYDEYVNIIDYKLKNIDDDAYLKQLRGYQKYIESTFNKKVNLYLYSILNEKMEKI